MPTVPFLVVASSMLVTIAFATRPDSSSLPASAQAQASAAPAREGYADLPGVHMWYRDSGGGGAPVVFLHAGTGSVLMWEYQFPAFTRAGHRVVVYDRIGHGRSEINPPGAQRGAAADDLEALLNYLRVERFHLVGTAAGGIVSLDYALSFPKRLRSLVIANSIGGVQDEDYLEMGRRLRPSPQFNAMAPEFRELGPSYRAGNPEGAARWSELEELSRSKTGRLPERMRNRITWSLLETIRIPTLLITGDADLYTPPAILRLFSKRMTTASSLILAEAGHSAYWEQPEMFNRAVLDFIRQH